MMIWYILKRYINVLTQNISKVDIDLDSEAIITYSWD